MVGEEGVEWTYVVEARIVVLTDVVQLVDENVVFLI